jgi:hypothetical protein
MKRVLSAVVLAMSIISVGCSDPVAPHGSVGELRINRQKWLATRPRDYTYHLALSAGIGFIGTVDVINGAAKVVASNGTRIDAPWASIEAAFDHAEQSLDVQPDSFEIEYDETLGYPRRISIDPRRLIADDEWGFVVTDLRLSITTLRQ